MTTEYVTRTFLEQFPGIRKMWYCVPIKAQSACALGLSLIHISDPSYHGLSYSKSFGTGAYITKATVQLMRDLGSIPSPQNAFLLNLGLETLHLRVPRHCEMCIRDSLSSGRGRCRKPSGNPVPGKAVERSAGPVSYTHLEGGIPFREVQGQVALFVLGSAVRERAGHGHLADGDAVLSLIHI